MPVEYDLQKFPPAPILEVRLSQPGDAAEREARPALIDTGGDFTTIPLDWLLQIDALHIGNDVLPGIEVIGIDEDDIEVEEDREIVLGRNVLNQLILLLDGPHQQTDILERRPVKF